MHPHAWHVGRVSAGGFGIIAGKLGPLPLWSTDCELVCRRYGVVDLQDHKHNHHMVWCKVVPAYERLDRALAPICATAGPLKSDMPPVCDTVLSGHNKINPQLAEGCPMTSYFGPGIWTQTLVELDVKAAPRAW